MTRAPLHETLPRLSDYRLMDQDRKHADPLVRRLIATWKKNVSFAYRPEQVDWRIGEDAYLLVAETAEALYGPGPWDELDYTPGSRPVLESILRDQLKLDPGTPDAEKALAIMRFSRDIRLSAPEEYDIFHGGTEEEVIKKSSAMCNEQTRVMIRLAQISGLAARYVGHITGDHGCPEVKIDGQWAYFDIRGHYYHKPDGRVASIWQLKCDPALIERQTAEAAKDIIPGRTPALTRKHTYRRAVTVIAPYRFADYDQRACGWTYSTAELRGQLAEYEKTWHALLDEIHAGADFTRPG